jgi:alpha-tubulin suppressor-like RCC1 family protein
MNLRTRPARVPSARPHGASGWPVPVVLGVCAAAVVLAATGCTSAPDRTAAEATVQPLPPQTSVVEHWGAVFGGTPAPGFLDQENSPTTVKLPGIVAQVGSSNSDEYALLTNGSVYAWGMGTQGELGDGGDVNSFEKPVRVSFPRGVKIAYLATDAMPYDTALAVDTQGHAWGWGNNSGGVFCLGNRHPYSTPVELPFSGVSTLAGANAHALYDAQGTVYACGSGLDGALGDGSTVSVTTPVRVPALAGAKVVKLVAAFENSGALLSDGEYLDWGYNANGQLGDGQLGGFSDVPVRANLSQPVVQVAQGGSTWGNGQTLALLSNGSLWVWGADYAGQLDTGTAGPGAAVPLSISLPAGTTVAGLATGSGTCYVVTTSGAVYDWGANYAGQIGNGKTQQASAPVMVATGATQISSTANNVVIDVPSARG